MKEQKQPAPETKDNQKRNEAAGNEKDGARASAATCASPSQLSDPHEREQASVATDTCHVVDAMEALPAPPSPEQMAKEQRYLARHKKRNDNEPPAPLFKFENDRYGERTETDHPNVVMGKALLMEALGTANPAFFERLKEQLIDLLKADSEEGVKDLNFVFSCIAAGRPEDELETMLLADMALVDLTLKRNAKEAFRIQDQIYEMLDVRSYPSRSKPRDPNEQKNEKFLTEGLALMDTAHRGIEKMAQTYARQLIALPGYRIKKAVAKKLSASEDLSSEPPINDSSGINEGGAVEPPVLSTKVVSLRGAKS